MTECDAERRTTLWQHVFNVLNRHVKNVPPHCGTTIRQSKKTTCFIAWAWLSVFITTLCQTCRRMVLWSGWLTDPLMKASGLRTMPASSRS